MARIRLMAPTNIYAAVATVLTASSSASALPVANSQTTDRTMVWRSLTATTVQTIDIDLGSVLSVSAVGMANLKLVGIGALEFYERGNAGSPGTANLVGTFPTQDADTRVTYLFFAAAAHRHWQLKWTNPGALSDYAEAGYVFVGTYLEPANNVVVPCEAPLTDSSVITKSLGGQRSVTVRQQQSRGRFSWEELLEAEAANLQAIFRTVGLGVPFFVVLDTGLSWTAWLLYCASDFTRGFTLANGRRDTGFDWEEAV